MALLTSCLASFPNSRIKPRPSTTTSTTKTVALPTGAALGTNVVLVAANANRTNLTFLNTSTTETMVYGYVDSADLGAAAPGLDQGIEVGPLRSVEILDPRAVYGHNFSDVAVIQVDIDEGSG